MNPIKVITQAYDEGHRALLITGRSVYDLVATDDKKVRTLLEQLRRTLKERYGMVLIQYSLAGGLDWDEPRIGSDHDRRAIRHALDSHHLTGNTGDPAEPLRVIRGVSSLCRTRTDDMAWSDGRPIAFAFLLEFAEHLVAGGLANGSQTDQQLVAVELAYLTSQSLALRSSGNLVAFHGRDGLVDDLVCGSLYHVRLPQPDEQEKLEFLRSTLPLYEDARLDDSLTLEVAAYLATNTPNRGLADLVRASHLSGRALSPADLSRQKSLDVTALSEGTLTVLDTGQGDPVRLHGRTIETPMRILGDYAERLVRRDRTIAANVALVGPPELARHSLPRTRRGRRRSRRIKCTVRNGVLWERPNAWLPCSRLSSKSGEASPLRTRSRKPSRWSAATSTGTRGRAGPSWPRSSPHSRTKPGVGNPS
jgi:hypothetical protein